MEVVSVNIGEKKAIQWRGKTTYTGIFKYPVNQAIHLGKTDVEKDHVIDRRYHGGIDKACYIFSADHYHHWQKLFPKLEWQYGMFGENISIKGLDENSLYIGDIYRLGETTVQVSQPRQPCFKLGIRFGTQTVIKKFIAQKQPGIYVRVLDEGKVNVGDSFELIERMHNSISIGEVWDLLYAPNPDPELLKFALDHPILSDGCKSSLRLVLKRLGE